MTKKIVCESSDSTVGSLLVDLIQSEKTTLVLVRGWDSQRQPTLIVESLARLGVESSFVPGGALVDLTEVDPAGLAASLFGFDELWLGNDTTNWGVIESTPPLTSDCVDIGRDDCSPFIGALLGSGAKLALADGCGLNVVRVLAES